MLIIKVSNNDDINIGAPLFNDNILNEVLNVILGIYLLDMVVRW